MIDLTVKRYSISGTYGGVSYQADPAGNLVTYTDHTKIVEMLRLAVEALQFYGDERNWDAGEINPEDHVAYEDDCFAGGLKAIETLASLARMSDEMKGTK